MSKTANIIRDGVVVPDDWTLIETAADLTAAILPTGKLIVPLGSWFTWRDALVKSQEPLGVWLDSNEDPAELADDMGSLSVIAVNFPKFTDGRGYTIAALLRSRYGFKGELRAIGDVLRDQLFYLRRVGFNAFATGGDKDIHDAVKALSDFSESYQGSIEQPLPLFRRRSSSVEARVQPSHNSGEVSLER